MIYTFISIVIDRTTIHFTLTFLLELLRSHTNFRYSKGRLAAILQFNDSQKKTKITTIMIYTFDPLNPMQLTIYPKHS